MGMKNMGPTLLNELNKLSVNKSKLAVKIKTPTRTLYNWFKYDFISWADIEKIAVYHPGILTAFDKHPDRPLSLIKDGETKYKSALEICQQEKEEWRLKYTMVMEKYTSLLEGSAR